MSRLNQIAPETATGTVNDLFTAVKGKLGLVPNMMRALGNAPAALNAYLQFSGALAHGTLPARVREQIALAVGEANSCDYCLAAHSAIGRSAGLTPDQIRDSRLGEAADPKIDALLRFARQVVVGQGRVSDDDLTAFRAAGWDDGAVAEVVANVALNVFTNYFNHVAQTDIDFPAAAPLEAAGVN